MKSSGSKLLEVHGVRKNLDPNILPEKQHTNPKNDSTWKSHIGQSRAGLRRRRPSPINQTIIQPSELSKESLGTTEIETKITNHTNATAPTHSINNANEGMTHTRPFIPDAPFYPGPTYRPPPKPVRSHTSENYEGSQSSNSSDITNMDPRINLDFKENSPF